MSIVTTISVFVSGRGGAGVAIGAAAVGVAIGAAATPWPLGPSESRELAIGDRAP